uniref:Uncharacterized protein n=1 Tax=Odontella aurita TaxID=265563 RepID=A0A7S4J5X1_9STRA|mmetsp:Transcript_39172/g.117781  ORF Transcript_39172/g.117781 Transcript_39172/m.117781 type:complete len:102 (+) Transcript_39172:111-416(+)
MEQKIVGTISTSTASRQERQRQFSEASIQWFAKFCVLVISQESASAKFSDRALLFRSTSGDNLSPPKKPSFESLGWVRSYNVSVLSDQVFKENYSNRHLLD